MNNFTFLRAIIKGCPCGTCNNQILQNSQLLEFYSLVFGVYGGENCIFLSFWAIFMKTHTMIIQTLSEHIMIVILHFSVKNLVFEQTSFIFQNNRSLRKSRVMDTENNLWKFEYDQIIFLDEYLKFKIQRNKSEWCNTCFDEYIYQGNKTFPVYLWGNNILNTDDMMEILFYSGHMLTSNLYQRSSVVLRKQPSQILHQFCLYSRCPSIKVLQHMFYTCIVS